MACTNPQIIYIRNSQPIDFMNRTHQQRAVYNKASFKYKKGYIPIEIPCGHCLCCKLDRANDWATRVTLESAYWTENCMLTLTYCDEALPHTKHTNKKTLCKADVQKFIKRLRKRIYTEDKKIFGKNKDLYRKIKYLYCGEYGPKGGRPHYHMCIFGWKPHDLEFYKTNKHGDVIYKSKTLYKGYKKDEYNGIWGLGFCTVEDLNYNTACYVARYCTKKAGLTADKPFWKNKPKIKKNPYWKEPNEPLFILGKEKWKFKTKPIEMYINGSIGIALRYWETNKERLKRDRKIPIYNNDQLKYKPLPKYFKKKWKEEDWESYHMAIYEDFKKSQENKKKIVEMENYPKDWTFEKKWQEHLKRIAEKLLNRCKRAHLLSRDEGEFT